MNLRKKWEIQNAPKGVLSKIKPLSTRINKLGIWYAEYNGADLKGTPFQVQTKIAVIRVNQKTIALYECE